MLGTRALALTTATLAFPAVALAEAGADLWQGRAGKSTVSIVRNDGHQAVQASIAYQCKDSMGNLGNLSAELTGKRKNNKIKLKGTAYNGEGTASIKAKVKTGKKATGSFKVSLTYDGVKCSVSHGFSLKYVHATGG